MLTTSFKKLKPFGAETSSHSLLENPAELRSLVLENKLMVFKNVKQTKESLISLSSKLSINQGPIQKQLLHWDFGPIMEMEAKVDPKNYLFSEESVPFHWDGAFLKEPLFLVFYCVKTSSTAGGETLFSDSEAMWTQMSQKKKEDVAKICIEYETEKLAHYGGKIQVNFVQEHPYKKSTILRFGEAVNTTMNPVRVSVLNHNKEKGDGFYKETTQSLYDPQFCYTHHWEEGDLLIADNFSLLHARNALCDNKERKFLRLQVL